MRWLMGLMLLAWGLVLVAWLVLHWAILPHIDEWRPRLEHEATQRLGLNLRIGQLTVRSGGWIPALEMHDLRLLDAQGRVALRLPKVAASLSARSLLALELRFEQLLIDSPELDIRRDAQGRILVAGMEVGEAGPAEAGQDLANWFFAQHEFVILNGRLRWVDEKRAAAPLALKQVNLVVRNGLRRHEFRLDASPPADWGQRFGLRGRFTQGLLDRPGDLSRWSGLLYADFPRADVRELRAHIDLPFDLREGDGALRAWWDVQQGQTQGVTLDMGLRSVRLRLNPKIEPLALSHIAGRLELQRRADQTVLKATQLGFEGDGDLRWPRSDWALTLRHAVPAPSASASAAAWGLDANELTGGELVAQQMDLALLSQLASRLPMAPEARVWLDELDMAGQLSDVQARWEGPLEHPQRYKLKGQVAGFSARAKAPSTPHGTGRPGWRGVDLSFDVHDQGGQARMQIRPQSFGALELPGVFQEPRLPITRLNAGLTWRVSRHPAAADAYELQVKDASFENEDLKGEFDATWRSLPATANAPQDRFPGWLDLRGRLPQVKAHRVARYLPLGMGEGARFYVRDAILAGEARNTVFKLRGDLNEFPFDRSRDGVFQVSTQARDLRFAFVPSHPATDQAPAFASPWPEMEHLSADLLFDKGSMRLSKGRAQLMGVTLQGVQGGIADLMHKQVLVLDGQVRGPAAGFLDFIKASPVSRWTGQALDQATMSREASLQLGLKLPLLDIDKSEVKGRVQLTDSDVRIRPDLPLLAGTRALIDFDQRGVQVSQASARVLGGEARFDGGSQKDGSLRFNLQGVATAEGVRQLQEWPQLARLGAVMNGQSPYRLELGVLKGQTEVLVSSTLQGMGLDLPAPLRKEPGTTLNLRYQTRLLPGTGAAAGPQDELRFELGSLLQGHYERDLSGAQARVLRGALAVQDSLTGLPPQGVSLQGNLDQLNLDAWQAVLPRLTAAAPADGLAGMEGDYAPQRLALRVQQLQLAGRKMSQVVAGITRQANPRGWHISADAEQFSGFVEWHDARGVQPAHVRARLARLSVPKSELDSVAQMLDKPTPSTQSVPTLDIVVDDLMLRGRHLGRVEIEAQTQGPQREWQLNRLQVRQPDAVLLATGRSVLEPGQAQRRTMLDWRMDVSDTGNLLERVGQGRVMRGGKGLLTGQLTWQGSPLNLDYGSLSGQVKVKLESGQFLKAEPGMARLLSVLSLQTLPRRLLLDFRDVFAAGFTFDSFGGELQIERGIASTEGLKMNGVQAEVQILGRFDLARETQDLLVMVRPDVNAGGASLAYAAVNPAIGLGTFLAQLILRKPMMAAGTEVFHISGSWDDPKVQARATEAAETLEAADGPASAASRPAPILKSGGGER